MILYISDIMVKIKEKKKEEIREIAEAIRKTLKEREQLKEIIKGWGPDLRPRGVQDISWSNHYYYYMYVNNITCIYNICAESSFSLLMLYDD